MKVKNQMKFKIWTLNFLRLKFWEILKLKNVKFPYVAPPSPPLIFPPVIIFINSLLQALEDFLQPSNAEWTVFAYR